MSHTEHTEHTHGAGWVLQSSSPTRTRWTDGFAELVAVFRWDRLVREDLRDVRTGEVETTVFWDGGRENA